MLLTIAAEECAEVAQRCTKAVRFGLEQVQAHEPPALAGPTDAPDCSLSNRERIIKEFSDLEAVLEMLGIGPSRHGYRRAKIEKVERYLAYSQECGQLEPR